MITYDNAAVYDTIICLSMCLTQKNICLSILRMNIPHPFQKWGPRSVLLPSWALSQGVGRWANIIQRMSSERCCDFSRPHFRKIRWLSVCTPRITIDHWPNLHWLSLFIDVEWYIEPYWAYGFLHLWKEWNVVVEKIWIRARRQRMRKWRRATGRAGHAKKVSFCLPYFIMQEFWFQTRWSNISNIFKYQIMVYQAVWQSVVFLTWNIICYPLHSTYKCTFFFKKKIKFNIIQQIRIGLILIFFFQKRNLEHNWSGGA